jgi:hypothetical protein
MKSVVVEASTLAKAIETAWLKAEKPEEFFIRVLQEHTSGFLGFGATKAKIVFFFKNTHKSDSLFPVVLKQKEYSSFFGNFNLKVPTELNVIDNELNKNVSLGGQHKKKPHNNQNNQQKPKQNNQQSDVRPRPNVSSSHGKPVAHPLANKAVQERNAHKAIDVNRVHQGQAVKQIKIQHNEPQQLSQDKILANTAAVNKLLQPTPKMQVSLQAPAVKKVVEHKASAQKEDTVKDIAKVLKKVQTQKIVANVSRPIHKTINKSVTPKFENYADFINSTTGIPVEKESITPQITMAAPKVEVITPLHKAPEEVVIIAKEEVVVSVQATPPVVMQSSASTTTAARVPLKMKRRPLTTENPGVSGITRSSSFVKTTADMSTEQGEALTDVQFDDTNKNDKE